MSSFTSDAWEAQEASRGSQHTAPPPPPTSFQPIMLTNPFHQQGYIATQPTQGQAAQPAPLPHQRDY